MNQKIVVGRFASPYSVHGWIKVISFTDPPAKILDYQGWCINKGGWLELAITERKLHGKHIIVKIKDCDTPEQAKTYTNIDIAINRDQLSELPPGEYYWAELEGLTVVNVENINFGKVDHVFSTGANDVLVVKGEKQRLIPYIKNVVKQVDLEKKNIIVDWDAEF